ncbi:MAG: hypothetical protein KF687_08930 [Cyclobacteriaceae bacterium]|nr:hypothetical protein [Cyclobacteriaceae bacterium]
MFGPIIFFAFVNLCFAQQGHVQKNQALELENYADRVNSGSIKVDTKKSSVKREAHGEIGNAHIVINYGSPGVRGR